MNTFRTFTWYLFGPCLHRVYLPERNSLIPYTANVLEWCPGFYLNTVNFCFNFVRWSALLWLPFMVGSFPTTGKLLSYAKIISYASCLYGLALVLRGLGRYSNPFYREFTEVYLKAVAFPSRETINALTVYGFMYTWPVELDVRTLTPKFIPQRQTLPIREFSLSKAFTPISWFLANSIGIRMLYPGCLGICNTLSLENRLDSREQMRLEHGVRRVGVSTADGEFVEVLYADKRTSSGADSESIPEPRNANTLVICCEGNAGFAEMGIASVPLSKGFSVLAWNHPGFGSSTGLPFPEAEKAAVEAVVLFAQQKLGFKPENILIYGWSIGGFTASWAAATFPLLGGLILDATFDNLDELGRGALSPAFDTITQSVIIQYLDLNIAFLVTKYPGPINLIRRAADEIISVGPERRRENNRGNYLLVELLKHRFPLLFTGDGESVLRHYLSLSAAQQRSYLTNYDITAEVAEPILQRQFRKEVVTLAVSSGNGNPEPQSPSLPFPSSLASTDVSDASKRVLLVFLASRYFTEVAGTHCTPLPSEAFMSPWSELDLMAESRLIAGGTVGGTTNGSGSSNGEESGEWEQFS